MKRNNPAMIPRSHLVEDALSAAEKGDLGKTHKLLYALHNPYGYTPEQKGFSKLPSPESCKYQTFCVT